MRTKKEEAQASPPSFQADRCSSPPGENREQPGLTLAEGGLDLEPPRTSVRRAAGRTREGGTAVQPRGDPSLGKTCLP